MLCPETGNMKKKPQHLRKLEKRKKKSSRRTKEEIDEKLKNADERRKVNSNNYQMLIYFCYSAFSYFRLLYSVFINVTTNKRKYLH